MEEYSRLLPYCTTKNQTDLIHTIITKEGNIPAVSEYLDKAATNLYRTIRQLTELADTS